MKKSSFFAMISRMKYINRWGLMRNIRTENLSEHTLQVAMVAHMMGIINNEMLGGDADADRLATLALYHDAAEIITGDMPTPVKYHDPSLKTAYKDVEKKAAGEMLSMLPEQLVPRFSSLFFHEEKDMHLWRLVKAADKISALLKCIEEENMGNREFTQAKNAQLKFIREMDLKEADLFLELFLDKFSLSLDELR